MGYIIPTQPNQSGLYAGRSNLDSYDYANIQRVRPVRMKSLFEEELADKLQDDNVSYTSGDKKSSYDQAASPQIQHAALSQEISLVVGKGLQINTYV